MNALAYVHVYVYAYACVSIYLENIGTNQSHGLSPKTLLKFLQQPKLNWLLFAPLAKTLARYISAKVRHIDINIISFLSFSSYIYWQH